MPDSPIISERLAWALLAFAGGLVLLAVAVGVALLLARRRRRAASADYVVRLLRNSAVPLAIQLLVRAIDLVFGIALYHAFAQQPRLIGDFVFAAFVTTVLLATIAEWGLNLFLTREVARDASAVERSFGTSLAMRIAFALLVIPASLLIVASYNGLEAAAIIPNGFDTTATLLVLTLACTVIPGAFSSSVAALFLATERPIVPALAQLLTNIVSALLKIAALLLGFGILGVAVAALLATLVNMLLFAVLLRRNWGWPRMHFERDLAARMLRAGWPLMLNSLLLAVFFRFDVTIIRAFREGELAAYDAAYKYVNLTQILPPIVINAIFPLFARQAASDRAALTRAYSYVTRLLVLLALPLATAATLLAQPLIAVYGGEYVPLGAPALQVLIWYLPLSYINGVTQYVLIALDRPKTITLAFGLAALFNVGFNLALVPKFGILAAALATVLAEVVLFVPLWRVLHAEIAPTAPWRMAWRPALATLGMAMAMVLAGQIHLLLSAGVALPVFAGLLLLLGVVQEDDRRLVRRVLGRV